jgi:hypothetical protein
MGYLRIKHPNGEITNINGTKVDEWTTVDINRKPIAVDYIDPEEYDQVWGSEHFSEMLANEELMQQYVDYLTRGSRHRTIEAESKKVPKKNPTRFEREFTKGLEKLREWSKDKSR